MGLLCLRHGLCRGAFGSARCKMIDLGKWLGEVYRISEPLRPDHFAEFEELSGDGMDASERR